MKKSKALTAAIVAGVITVGAGYAWWTDALTIKNTVNTGELNVKFVESKITDDANGYVKAVQPIVKDKEISFAINNMYPGITETFEAKFENNGTIPAVVSDVTYEATAAKGNDLSLVKIKGDIKVYDENSKVVKTYPIDSDAKEFKAAINKEIANKLRVEPKGYVKFEGVKITLDSKAENSYEKETINMKLGLNFKQHNQQ